jgi:hypothetical protein
VDGHIQQAAKKHFRAFMSQASLAPTHSDKSEPALCLKYHCRGVCEENCPRSHKPLDDTTRSSFQKWAKPIADKNS